MNQELIQTLFIMPFMCYLFAHLISVASEPNKVLFYCLAGTLAIGVILNAYLYPSGTELHISVLTTIWYGCWFAIGFYFRDHPIKNKHD